MLQLYYYEVIHGWEKVIEYRDDDILIIIIHFHQIYNHAYS